jgi:hypothetical protein
MCKSKGRYGSFLYSASVLETVKKHLNNNGAVPQQISALPFIDQNNKLVTRFLSKLIKILCFSASESENDTWLILPVRTKNGTYLSYTMSSSNGKVMRNLLINCNASSLQQDLSDRAELVKYINQRSFLGNRYYCTGTGLRLIYQVNGLDKLQADNFRCDNRR